MIFSNQASEACGCSGIVLTLDPTMLGWRPRDLDLAYLPFMRDLLSRTPGSLADKLRTGRPREAVRTGTRCGWNRCLAIAGEVGVREVLRNIVGAFDLTMGLAGCRSLDEITRDCVVRDV